MRWLEMESRTWYKQAQKRTHTRGTVRDSTNEIPRIFCLALAEEGNEKCWQGQVRNTATPATPAVHSKQKAAVMALHQQFISLSVLLTNHYGLHGPPIESRWRRDSPHPSRPPLGPSSLLHNGYRAPSQGVKLPGRGVNHPPHQAQRLKKK
jgi:hypothetical protein